MLRVPGCPDLFHGLAFAHCRVRIGVSLNFPTLFNPSMLLSLFFLLLSLFPPPTTASFGSPGAYWNRNDPVHNPCLTYMCAPGFQCFNHGRHGRECFNPTTGVYGTKQALTEWVGNGNAGNSIDGTGTNARITNPAGIVRVAGTFGDFLFTEDLARVLRYVTASGVVTILAGLVNWSASNVNGVGSVARFMNPGGLTYSFVTDMYYMTDDRTIRSIKLQFPVANVTTLAGLSGSGGTQDGIGSQARFAARSSTDATGVLNFNGGITIHADGIRMFVADSNNQRIRQVTVYGAVTTLAVLSPVQQYSMGIQTVDDMVYFTSQRKSGMGSGGLLSSIDLNNGNTLTMFSSDQHVTTNIPTDVYPSDSTPWAGRSMRGLHITSQGDWYVADWNQIRKYDLASNTFVTTSFGTPCTGPTTCPQSCGFVVANNSMCELWGLSSTADGTLVILLRGAGRIVKLTGVPDVVQPFY